MDIADVLSQRVRMYRAKHRMSQQDLANRLAELGHPMNRVTLAKIEAGGTRARNATLADVLMLAAALDVSPPLLFLPLAEGELVRVGSMSLHPRLVLDWWAGRRQPLVDTGADHV